jgi:hypothetical protein
VIRMLKKFSEIKCCAPLLPDFECVFNARAYAPFSDEVMLFLQTLSTKLLQDSVAKDYPDVISFAFWCRIGGLRAMKACYADHKILLGRGVVFHIAPSNVPVNFAYSLVVGLLAGNVNIVRIPSRAFPQVEIICLAIRELLCQGEFEHLINHVVLLRYERNDEITDFFSARCDVRVIWGGDHTIEDIRRSPLPPRSFDLTFADRYSFCVINADAYPGDAEPSRIALDFYNDTYLFDQNACTAPHLVVWLGTKANVKMAQELFWRNLHGVVAEKYEMQSVSVVNKLADAYRFAASTGACSIIKMEDNLIVRIQLDHLSQGIEDARSMCGYFYEYAAATLDDILPLINRKYQTLAYYGIDRAVLQGFIEKKRPFGIDRMVPIGRTLDFSLTWDGYDLIGMLSRTISLSP